MYIDKKLKKEKCIKEIGEYSGGAPRDPVYKKELSAFLFRSSIEEKEQIFWYISGIVSALRRGVNDGETPEERALIIQRNGERLYGKVYQLCGRSPDLIEKQ